MAETGEFCIFEYLKYNTESSSPNDAALLNKQTGGKKHETVTRKLIPYADERKLVGWFLFTQMMAAKNYDISIQKRVNGLPAWSKLKCELCGNLSTCRRNLRNHYWRMHTNVAFDEEKAVVKCPNCGRPFASAQALTAHFQLTHKTAGKGKNV